MEKRCDLLLHGNLTDNSQIDSLVERLKKYSTVASQWSLAGKFREMLVKRMGLDELRNLCQDMNVNHEILAQTQLIEMARELVNYFEKRQMIEDLYIKVINLREDLKDYPLFPEIYEMSQYTNAVGILVDSNGVSAWENTLYRKHLVELVKEGFQAIIISFSADFRDPPDYLGNVPLCIMGFDGDEESLNRIAQFATGREASLAVSKWLINKVKEKSEPVKGVTLDTWAMSRIKGKLHEASELLGDDALKIAEQTSGFGGGDVFDRWLPLTVDLAWHRGYYSALTRLLKVPPATRTLAVFTMKEVSPRCPVMDGVLGVQRLEPNKLQISLNNNPAVEIHLRPGDSEDHLIRSIKRHGRLGIPSNGGKGLVERIGEIPFNDGQESMRDLPGIFYKNREALVVLLSRYGLPNGVWMSGNDQTERLHPMRNVKKREPLPVQILSSDGTSKEQIFAATGALKKGSSQTGLNMGSLRETYEKLLKMDHARTLFGDRVDTDPEGVIKELMDIDFIKGLD